MSNHENSKNKIYSKGFSLIELMVVIAIVGILAAVAVPSYRDYILRSEVVEGITVAHKYQKEIEEYYNLNGTWTDGVAAWLLGDGTSGSVSDTLNGIYVDAAGELQVNFDTRFGTSGTSSSSAVLKLTPSEANGIISWTCADYGGTWAFDTKHAPSNCQ